MFCRNQKLWHPLREDLNQASSAKTRKITTVIPQAGGIKVVQGGKVVRRTRGPGYVAGAHVVPGCVQAQAIVVGRGAIQTRHEAAVETQAAEV